jgi:hypothetical protein
MFLKLVHVWKHLTVEEVSAKVKHLSFLFLIFSINEHEKLVASQFVIMITPLIFFIFISCNTYASKLISIHTATELQNTRMT